jgi:hypothetical protein
MTKSRRIKSRKGKKNTHFNFIIFFSSLHEKTLAAFKQFFLLLLSEVSASAKIIKDMIMIMHPQFQKYKLQSREAEGRAQHHSEN